MFFSSDSDLELFENFEAIGLKDEICHKKDVLIKVNLGRVYVKNHPRTDMTLLRTVINYVCQNGGRCAIAEGAGGHLTENVHNSGLKDIIERYKVKIIDIDAEDCEEVISCGEYHYIPRCFEEYPVRIAIPAASKREGMLYSNNVKLFVGAVPRSMYQLGDVGIASTSRPRLHINLDASVAHLFLAMEAYSTFQFYVNGGLAYNENAGEFVFTETYVGNDALELDKHIFDNYFSDCEYPDYLNILETRLFGKQ